MQQQKKAAASVLLNQTASMTASAHVQLQLFFAEKKKLKVIAQKNAMHFCYASK